MLNLSLTHLTIFWRLPSLNEVDDVLLQNSSFFTRSLHLSQVYLVLPPPHLYCRRCKYLLMSGSIMLDRLRLDELRLFSWFRRLFLHLGSVCFHFEEDISDLAGLILAVVELLDGSLLGRGYLGELFVGFDIG